ncbi:hypothetical protein [Caudoviricetes sp.]|nr:hypothetical protein [Caudoviricetes sp.]
MSAHSKIGASSMHRWSNCPGSVKLCQGIKSSSSSYAEEGTRAHEVAAAILENIPFKNVDPEMLGNVDVYVNAVVADWNEATADGSEMLVEHKFDLSTLYPGLFGTADCVIYDAGKELLRVYDLKYGAGIAVEVFENEQLMYYALGALLTTNFKVKDVELVIAQPRCPHPDGPIRRWCFNSLLLIDFSVDLVHAAEATANSNAPLVPGDWCRFCPAAGICPTLHDNALILAKEEFAPAYSYDPEKLSKTLVWLPILESWIKNVRNFAYQEAIHGRIPPDWKIVDTRASRRWKDKETALSNLVDVLGIDEEEIFNKTLKSPAQIEKLLPKEKQKLLNEFVIKESSGSTLVPAKDKRNSTSFSEFSIITDEEV